MVETDVDAPAQSRNFDWQGQLEFKHTRSRPRTGFVLWINSERTATARAECSTRQILDSAGDLTRDTRLDRRFGAFGETYGDTFYVRSHQTDIGLADADAYRRSLQIRNVAEQVTLLYITT